MLASQKVTLNTAVMYAKMVITIGITLYATRIILKELGANDFGIFNVVAGAIMMLSVLNAAMSTSVRRYLSNALGSANDILFARIFHASVRIHLLFGVISIVILELAGLFLFNGFLNLSPERLMAAYIVYQCMIISTFFSIITIPYTSAINAHEDLYVISVIYIIESLFKLGIAFYLQYTPFDKLITYGFLLAFIYSLTTIIQRIYCYRHYVAIRLKPMIGKDTYRSLLHFFGYSSLSYVSKIISDQGMILVLNVLGGTVINAAYAIANQVNGQMNYFSASLLQAIEPQIMKSEGAGNHERMLRLSVMTCKFSFFIVSFFSIPILIWLPYLLSLWLEEVPQYTVVFCRIILVATILSQLTLGLQSGIYAKGDIKHYQIVISVIQLLALPLAVLLVYYGLPLYSILTSFVIIEVLLLGLRLYYAQKTIELPIGHFLKKIILPSLFSFAVCYVMTNALSLYATPNFIGFVLMALCSFLIFLLLFWLVMLTKEERVMLTRVLKGVLIKLKRR